MGYRDISAGSRDINLTEFSATWYLLTIDKLRKKLGRFRRKSREPARHSDISSTSSTFPDPSLCTTKQNSSIQSSELLKLPGSSDPFHEAENVSKQSTTALDEVEQTAVVSEVDTGGDGKASEIVLVSPVPAAGASPIAVELANIHSDLWSAAYREAVESLGEDIKTAILKGDSVAELFKQLEQMEKDSAQELVFIRGVKYLRSLQVPLERFKLALDLATPLTSLEPTTATVYGVVRSVTEIAISFSTADLAFAQTGYP
ncbi:hypothetical protein V8F06_014528 [Rhypophila decipiens]